MTRAEPAKTITAREAAGLVRSGDWVDYGAVLAQPDVFDQALAERACELHNVSFRGCLSVRPRAVVDADPGREHFNYFNWHFGAYDRQKGDAGLQNYIPCNLGETTEPTVARTRDTVVRSAPGEISSASASHSERNRRGECRARIASRRRWLALGRSINDPSLENAHTAPSTCTLAMVRSGSPTLRIVTPVPDRAVEVRLDT
jgi:hypothetical protein